MKPAITDIDIDVPDRKKVLDLFTHTIASNHGSGTSRQHNTGVYFHDVPVDPFSNRCSIDYKEAEDLGYFKIDVLNVSIYKDIRDEKHMNELLEREPVWQLLEEKDFCDLVFHMKGHHNICREMKPRTLEQLAAVLAIIRPAKRHLIGKSWYEVMQQAWTIPKDNNQYYFKKSHAFSYAMAVKLHMNLLIEELSK